MDRSYSFLYISSSASSFSFTGSGFCSPSLLESAGEFLFLFPHLQQLVREYFKSRATRIYTPLCRSVRWSVGLSVCRSVGRSIRHTLLFFGFCGLWSHCSCPNNQVTSNMAPAHPHATGVAVYPALFFLAPFLKNFLCPKTRAIFRSGKKRKSYFFL